MASSSFAPLASIFKITELSGDQRVMVLQYRGVPYRGLPFKGTQRVDVTWLPGAPVGTSTVLGPTEEPTQMNGMWKDIFFGEFSIRGSTPPCMLINGTPVTSVKDAVAFMDSFRRLGQLIRVNWAHIIRVGHLASFEHTWDNEHDVRWNIEWKWISQGDTPGPVVPAGGPQLADIASSIRQQMDDFDNVPMPKGFGLANGFLNQIQEAQQKLDDLILNIEDTVVTTTDQVMAPVRAARGIMTTLRGIQTECDDLIGFVRGQVAGNFNGTNTNVSNQSFGEQIEAERFRCEMLQWCNELRRQSIEQRSQLQSQVNYAVVGTYIAHANDDLRNVSKIFYGTPFEWRRIMVYNGLDSSELTQGEVVLVPDPAQLSEADQGWVGS